MIDVVVNVYYKGDDDKPTPYRFDEREPLCSFLWDCRFCDNIIDKIDIVVNISADGYYNDVLQTVKLFANKTIIKKLHAVELERKEIE